MNNYQIAIDSSYNMGTTQNKLTIYNNIFKNLKFSNCNIIFNISDSHIYDTIDNSDIIIEYIKNSQFIIIHFTNNHPLLISDTDILLNNITLNHKLPEIFNPNIEYLHDPIQLGSCKYNKPTIKIGNILYNSIYYKILPDNTYDKNVLIVDGLVLSPINKRISDNSINCSIHSKYINNFNYNDNIYIIENNKLKNNTINDIDIILPPDSNISFSLLNYLNISYKLPKSYSSITIDYCKLNDINSNIFFKLYLNDTFHTSINSILGLPMNYTYKLLDTSTTNNRFKYNFPTFNNFNITLVDNLGNNLKSLPSNYYIILSFD